MRINLSILQYHLPQLNNTQYTHPKDSDATDLYATIWSSAVLMKRALWDPCLLPSSTSDSSPVCRWAEPPSQVQLHMNYHHTSTPSTDQLFQDATAKTNSPTAPLDDDIWLEDPIPDRHLCIHEQSQLNYQCSYPLPIQLGPTTILSRRCNGTLLWADGP